MTPWCDRFKGDLLPWLLEPENPPVRYRTLTTILGQPDDGPEVRTAQSAVAGYSPVAELQAAQKQGGYWVGPDYYLPKHYGTFGPQPSTPQAPHIPPSPAPPRSYVTC